MLHVNLVTRPSVPIQLSIIPGEAPNLGGKTYTQTACTANYRSTIQHSTTQRTTARHKSCDLNSLLCSSKPFTLKSIEAAEGGKHYRGTKPPPWLDCFYSQAR